MRYKPIQSEAPPQGMDITPTRDCSGATLPALKNSRGFSLLELLIALALVSIGLLGIARMQISAIRGNGVSRDFTEAAIIAQDQIEILMATPYGDVSDNMAENQGYAVQWTVSQEMDLNGDGVFDMKALLLTVDDPTGNRRTSLTFLKPSGI